MKITSGFGFSYAGFGELLQGVLPNDRKFLITLPINLKSNAIFIPTNDKFFSVFPKEKKKVQYFADLFANYYSLNVKGNIIIDSEIPIGKGLSSSTADIVAVSKALSQGCKISYNPTDLESLIRQIEPSDGLLYEGVVAYYHKEVSLLKRFNYNPGFVIASIDEGGVIDTIKYNQITHDPSANEKDEFEKLLNKFIKAVELEDIKNIGYISTRSAELNQKYNYKKHFSNLLKINNDIDGLGVICAHSGTYIGVLLNETDNNLLYKTDYCCKEFKKLDKKMELFYSKDKERIGV